MINQNKHFKLLLFISLVLFSCKSNDANKILSYQVVRGDYIDDFIIDGVVEAVNTRTVSCPRVWNVSISYLIEDGTNVNEGDTLVVLENKQLEDQYEQMLRNLEQNKAEYNKNQADLALNFALLEAQVKNNEAQTAITSLDSLQLQYASETQRKITSLELEIARIEKEKYQKKLNALKKINLSELRKFDLRIKQSENQVLRIKESLEMLVITAPQAGFAMLSNSPLGTGKLKEGDQIYPGMAMVELPDLSQMRVRIQANESAYKRISMGDKVEYTFDAMPGNFAQGLITMKAPVGVPINRNSKVRVFDVLASIDSSNVLPGAGLSANCRIISKYIADTIVVPTVAVFDDDSIKVVYVAKKKGYEKREVKIGTTSPQQVVIAAGLLPGETIAMIKPDNKYVVGTLFLGKEINALQEIQNGNKTDSIKYDQTEIQNE